jgi:ParB-like chromosome segregation protein Spo0J
MNAVPGRWQPARLPREVRRMAEAAAAAAGLPLAQWLGQVIRATSALERVAPDTVGTGAAQKALALLAETLGSADMPPLDEARAYFRLITEFGLNPGEIAHGVGRPQEQIARALRLLTLPPHLRELIERRALSAADAYALLDTDDPERLAQAALALGSASDDARRSARAGKGRA